MEAKGRQRWLTLGTVIIGYFGASWAMGPVSALLPTISREFGVAPDKIGWAMTVYLLSLVTFLLPAGRLGDLYGHRKLFTIGAATYGLSALLVWMVNGLLPLVVLRAFQGLAAALIFGSSMALISRAFPPDQRGRAIGLVSMTASVAALVGVWASALFVTHLSWHWTFLTVAPISLLSAVGGTMLDRDTVKPGARIDWLGIIALVGTLAAFSLSVTHLHDGDQTFHGGLGYHGTMHAVTLALLGLFIWTQRRAKDPLIPFAPFRSPFLRAALLGNSILHLGMMGSLFLVPFLVEKGLALTPTHTASAMVPMQVTITAMAPISGWLCDRGATRWLLPGAMLVLAGSMAALGALAVQGLTFPVLLVLSTLLGVGQGLYNTANNAELLNSVSQDLKGFANGMLEMTKQFGHSLGATIASTFAAAGVSATASPEIFLAGFGRSSFIMAAIAAAGVVVSLVRPSAASARVPQQILPER